jgi:hypothetical protein
LLSLGDIPAGVTALALNVTITGPQGPGYATISPYDHLSPSGPVPTASNLNFTAGQTVPNMVIVPVDPFDPGVIRFLATSTTEMIVDLVGFFVDPSVWNGVGFRSSVPSRILDTRTAIGVPGTSPVGGGGTVHLQVSGHGGVPADAEAVLLNLTVTQPTGDGYVTAWPSGTPQPDVSSLNFTPGLTAPNLVLVPLGSGGAIDVYNSAGSSHITADVVGWFD